MFSPCASSRRFRSSFATSPLARVTRRAKEKRNGTCVWSALLLALSTAAPSTATTLTGLGSDGASAIVRFRASVSASRRRDISCGFSSSTFGIVSLVSFLLKRPRYFFYLLSPPPPPSLSFIRPRLVTIRRETVLVHSLDAQPDDTRRRDTRGSCDAPLPLSSPPLTSHRSVARRTIGECNIKYGNSGRRI